MAQTDTAARPPPPGRRALPVRWGNPLVRGVSRAPFTVRTKLLVAFAAIAIVLVTVAALGLRVLGQANARIEALGALQLRAATYQGLQTQAQQLRQLLALRVAADPNVTTYIGGNTSPAPGGTEWVVVDEAIIASLSQLGPATNESRFGFVPPAGDERILVRIRGDFRDLTRLLDRIAALDRAGSRSRSQELLTSAIAADNDLGALTDTLATMTRAEAANLIALSRASYLGSRDLFVGVGVASILLALLLGFVLSRSLVEPLQLTGARLAEIAEGDFSKHIAIDNRDELGDLAANLNRMNDELRRLYEELETVSRHKSEFVANMSHELRTPLNAVIGFSELLQQQSAGSLNERQREYIADVLEAGRHLLSLINDILDLSKVEAGRMELELADIRLRPVLESGLAFHAETASRAGVTLGLRCDDGLVIEADERKVRQVVFNLLSNAIKFTPAGGQVAVSVASGHDVVEVVVEDTGAGIAPDDRELIFEEFRQGRSSGGDGAEGTGLGLPLSRRLVELHGGRLWVESVRGGGSAFHFTLPVVREAQAA
jgi:signal transduction histidine kinase